MSNLLGLALFAILIAAIIGVAQLVAQLEYKNYEE
jgi:hypothetical protein